MQEIGKMIIIAGMAIIIVGLLIYFDIPLFKWFGNLPGDINIKRENTQIFIPITSMILISIVFSLSLYILRKIFNF